MITIMINKHTKRQATVVQPIKHNSSTKGDLAFTLRNLQKGFVINEKDDIRSNLPLRSPL